MGRLIVAAAMVLMCGCAEETCTQIGCGDTSIVTFPRGLVEGPYDLEVTAMGTTWRARCLQPASAEAVENSIELECDANTFELTLPAGTSPREVQVTVVDVVSETVLIAAVTVALDAVSEDTPNGPDCPPICFIRNGAVVIDGAE